MVVSFARPEAVMDVFVRSAQHATRTESTHLRSKNRKTCWLVTCGQTRYARRVFFGGFALVTRAILMFRHGISQNTCSKAFLGCRNLLQNICRCI